MRTSVKNPLPGVVYAPEERLRAYVEAGALPLVTLGEAFMASFAAHADRVAIHAPEGDVTYAELDSITDRIGAALLRLGLQPLDRVLFQSANCRELIFALIGCFKAGLIPVCTLPAHREREIGYLGCHADAQAHIVQGDDPRFDLVDFALRMKAQIPSMKQVISIRGAAREGAHRLEDLIAAEDPAEARKTIEAVERDPFQVGIFQLSGGTTGVPKIIPRMSNDYYLNMKLTADWLGYRPDDVMFCPMPMIHNACMMCIWGPALLSGAAYAIPASLEPGDWARVFNAHRPTWIGTIRALLPRLETMLDEGMATFDSVRAFWCPDAAALVRQRYKVMAYSMFGMSEGLNMYVHPDDPLEARDTGVGRPLSPMDEVRLVEPGTDREVGLDEVGEFTCRGPYTLSGYYNAPERNLQGFTADGFYRSGDLMVKREYNGEILYAFAGRNKDLVSRGHEKVNAEELEAAVASFPTVADCAVVGMPDPVLGERVCAFVVAKKGRAAPGVAELGEHLRGLGLAKFKWPERIEEIDALPLTKVGKLDKARMREIITAKLASPAES